MKGCAQTLCFFGNQISDKHRIDASSLRRLRQPIFAEFQEGIEITEQYNGHVDVLLCV